MPPVIQCRQCQGENPAEARFCLHCGAPQAIRCGQCGRDLPAEARFCMACGQAVGGTPAVPSAPSVSASAAPVTRPPRSEPFRIADLAAGEEILTSSLTAELLRSAGDLRFEAEREVELKGLEGRHRVFALGWR